MRVLNNTIMNKLKVIIIIVIALLLLVSIYFAVRQNNPSSNNGGQGASSTPTMTISTPRGDVNMRDITKNPPEQVPGNIVFKKTSEYEIVYFDEDKTFSITVESKPLRQTRQAAEQAFTATLGISNVDACKLSVSLTVPFDVDENLSGKNYGLSFCPEGIEFAE